MDLVREWQEAWGYLQHVSVAFALTATIGWEREESSHGAGIRTFPIVGMASCGYLLLLGSPAPLDAEGRLLQGLITGIGFIGGGAILKDSGVVKGTATAASVWNAGVIGAAVAMNKYSIAILLTILNIFTMRGLLPLKRWLDKREQVRNDS